MSEDVNNILNKALINADLNSMQNDVKQSNVPQDWRAKLDIGEDGGYFISTPRNANELPDAVELFKDFDLEFVIKFRGEQFTNVLHCKQFPIEPTVRGGFPKNEPLSFI